MSIVRFRSKSLLLLKTIADAPSGLTWPEIRKHQTHQHSDAQYACIGTLRVNQLIERIAHEGGIYKWTVTRKGLDMIAGETIGKQKAKPFRTYDVTPTLAEPRRINVFTAPRYEPHLYIKTVQRAGSDDAFRLPSRIGRVWV